MHDFREVWHVEEVCQSENCFTFVKKKKKRTNPALRLTAACGSQCEGTSLPTYEKVRMERNRNYLEALDYLYSIIKCVFFNTISILYVV